MSVRSADVCAIQGTPSEDKHATITQPAPVRRMNDRGGMYTKVSCVVSPPWNAQC